MSSAERYPAWSHRAIAEVTGIDRDEDFTEAEREDPGCIMAIAAAESADCSTIDRTTLVDMLSRVLPGASTPWHSLWWTPRVHLAIFVHRVEQVPPGLYLLMRDPRAFDRLRAACRPDFLWEAADDGLPLRPKPPARAQPGLVASTMIPCTTCSGCTGTRSRACTTSRSVCRSMIPA